MKDFDATLTRRWWLLSAWTVVSSLLFLRPVIGLVRLSFSQDDASHLVIIPFIAVVVLYLERQKVSKNISTDKTLAGTFLVPSGLLVLVSFLLGKSALGLQLSASILALILLWVSGFSFLFGRAALRVAHFPFLFLLLMVPIPTFALDRMIHLLQEGSAWITGVMFDLLGVPALREGLVFHLAKVNIEIAKECSGIRSSMALFILALLVAHFELRSFKNKVVFMVFGLFMMILKNGVRIATLTLLAVYVDPGFLFGRLHHQGGVVFFVLALLLLLPLLRLLRRRESKDSAAAEPLNPESKATASDT